MPYTELEQIEQIFAKHNIEMPKDVAFSELFNTLGLYSKRYKTPVASKLVEKYQHTFRQMTEKDSNNLNIDIVKDLSQCFEKSIEGKDGFDEIKKFNEELVSSFEKKSQEQPRTQEQESNEYEKLVKKVKTTLEEAKEINFVNKPKEFQIKIQNVIDTYLTKPNFKQADKLKEELNSLTQWCDKRILKENIFKEKAKKCIKYVEAFLTKGFKGVEEKRQSFAESAKKSKEVAANLKNIGR